MSWGDTSWEAGSASRPALATMETRAARAVRVAGYQSWVMMQVAPNAARATLSASAGGRPGSLAEGRAGKEAGCGERARQHLGRVCSRRLRYAPCL